jgi:anti-sigma regulatory factor (Ser/Thr protein kinase)
VSTETSRLSLELAPRLDEIGRLNVALEAFGKSHDLPARLLFDMNLVLDELITNVIVHGLEIHETAPIMVELAYEAGQLTAHLRDKGRPFDPTTVSPPDVAAPLHERKIGGLGVHLARTLTDSLSYRYDGQFNHMTLTKRRREETE